MTLPLPSSPHWPPTRMMTKALLGSRLGPPRLQVIEAGVVAAELELDHPGRAVAVLGHDHLGNAWFLVGLVVLGAEKEGDDVRVLLNAVVDNQISCHEVMEIFDSEVINFFGPTRLHGFDHVPIDIACGEEFPFVRTYFSSRNAG